MRALVALGFSLFVLVRFTLPAIVANEPPIAVASVTSALIMLVALYLSHGFNARTTSEAVTDELPNVNIIAGASPGELPWTCRKKRRLNEKH